MTRKHFAHNHVRAAVRAWFHEARDKTVYRVERRTWGTYWSTGQVYTEGFPPAYVPSVLRDLRAYYSNRVAITICLDDRSVEAELGSALRAVGCVAADPDIFLAHVGSLPALASVTGLAIEPVTAENIGTFTLLQLQAFGNTEETPDAAQLERATERRRAELAGSGAGLLARLADEPAALVWWHDEQPDRWVHCLGTRLPFRRRGIAGHLLRSGVADAYERGYRSVVVDVTTSDDAALRQYRRLGFCDEVYWRRCYHVEP